MYRYRLAFRKESPACWVGHLDLVRLFEQALRRSALPVVYSGGFNPRPRLVFAAPLPVGVRGLRELVDVYLSSLLSPALIQERLAAVLPQGLALVGVRRVPLEAPALASLVAGAAYRAEGELAGITPREAETTRQAILEASSLPYQRRGPKGAKEVDLRPGIRQLQVEVKGEQVVLEMLVRAGQEGNVRPEEVVALFLKTGGFAGEPEDFYYCRTALFAKGPGEKLIPLF
ncbi:TIGR03936 family radical SAM-associated protein [Ammonifex thiophilus]|uniref:DUF2344 domain-containing protein n=1 Tax=Ammonifex thiophilus TaxID=444093 RepID=A0A3D8P8R6_9THEO|nr:TIGR03936 family radical SAM-associated protein [Ammonifex thiophilus]RDV84911.1 DUF2344 domain-containing protein [Ammonifex thiophilus]